MGGEQSNLSGIEGFQIVRVMPSSPAHVAGLMPFFDIILSVDNIQLQTENNRVFKEYVHRNKNNVITLSVFNTRIRMVREVSLTPSDTWGGLGLLGCSINWESVEKTIECVWHIVDVTAGGAASQAGVAAGRDYIVGMQCLAGEDRGLVTMLSHPGDFHARLEQWAAERQGLPKVGQVEGLLLLLYDKEENSLREVMVAVPRGQPLGVDVASGVLHQVPYNQNDSRLPFMKVFYLPGTNPVPSQVYQTQPQLQTVPVSAISPAQQLVAQSTSEEASQQYVPALSQQVMSPPTLQPPPAYQQPPPRVQNPTTPVPPTGWAPPAQLPGPSPMLQAQQQQQFINTASFPPPPPSAPQAPQWGASYKPPFVFPTLPPMPQPITPK